MSVPPGTTELPTQTEVLNELAVAQDIRALHVVQQAPTAADHPEEALATMMVLLVSPEVIRQVVDPLGEERNLHARRAGVGLV